MVATLIVSALAVSLTLAFPAEKASGGAQTPIPILSQSSDVNGNGNFTYTYETGDGIKFQQAGFVKPIPPGDIKAVDGDEDASTGIQVIKGSYAYTAPDGTLIELQYTADENGFQPQGAHLPTAHPAQVL